MRVLVSYNLIQALWLNRAELVEYADQLWELMCSGQIQGYITQKGLDIIHCDLIYLLGEEKADKEVSNIRSVVEVSPVDPMLIEQALSYNLRDFESEIELACAVRMNLDAIVTQHPQNFSGANFPIFSVTDLLRQKLEQITKKDIFSFSDFPQHPQNFDSSNFPVGTVSELLHQETEDIREKNVFNFSEHINQLNLNFYEETPLQLCLFPTSDVEPDLSYRIRNSINKVLKVFKILKEEGCTGLVHKELAKKAKCSEKTLDSIILDLKNFNMVVFQGYKVLVPPYLLKYEDNQIADYIANFLKRFLVTKEIYKQIKPGKTTTRPSLQKLIANISSNRKPIDPKSSSDYTSRMLSWFFFTGLLESRGNGMIYRPIIKGKHKRKLRDTAEIQQLNLFAEL